MKTILIILLLCPVFIKAQTITKYTRTDTVKAALYITTGIGNWKRFTKGYVIVKRTPNGCRAIGFLTYLNKPFPKRFTVVDFAFY